MINPEFEVVSIPQAVGTVATNGILCGIKSVVMVSIPQAVGTVATRRFKNESIKRNEPVSIPQAVGTVATTSKSLADKKVLNCFNTASGRYCCNPVYS